MGSLVPGHRPYRQRSGTGVRTPGSVQLHRGPGGAHQQHVAPHGLVVNINPDHRVGAQTGRLLLHLGQRIADPGSEFVLVGLGPAAEDIAHAGAHVLECVHAEHALGGDDAEVFGHGAALDPGGGRDEHVRSSLHSSASVRFPMCAHNGLDAAAHTEMMTCQGGSGQAGLMSLEGLSGLMNRIIAWADRLQREHGVLGFPYAVIKKYGDDAGGRQAALITYYGFLSIFPLLLLGVAVLSRVLADHPDLRQRLIAEIVPKALRPTVEHSLATLPTSTIPLVVGLIGLLFSGTGVVFSAYQTLNHVAVVRYRFRAGFLSRYVRVFAVLATLMAGALATGALTVVATALPGQPAVQRAAAVLRSALVVFAVLLLGAKLLLARPRR